LYEIISVLRQSAIVRDFDVLELIDEDSVKLIKIKAVLEKNWLLYITELHTKVYRNVFGNGSFQLICLLNLQNIAIQTI
jgi:hypothetical protein